MTWFLFYKISVMPYFVFGDFLYTIFTVLEL